MKILNFSLKAICSLTLMLLWHSGFAQSRIDIYNDSIRGFLYNNPNKAKYFSHKLLQQSKASELPDEEAKAYCFLADLSGALNQKDSAFYYFDKAIQKTIESGNQKLELVFKINKASYLFNLFDFETALTLYDECLRLSTIQKNEEAIDYILIKKASIDYELERYSDALKGYKSILAKNNSNIINSLNIKLGLVKVYLKLNLPDSANVYIKSGIVQSKKSHLNEHEIHFMMQSGIIYMDMKKYKLAKSTFDDALNYAVKVQNTNLVTEIKIKISKLYLIENKPEDAITLLKSMTESENKKIMPVEYLSEIYYLLAESYKATGDHSDSNFYYKQFIEKSAKIGQKRIDAINHLFKIDMSKIREQENDQKKQKWFVAAFATILVFIIIGLYVRRRKNNIQNQEKFDQLILKIRDFEEQNEQNEHNTTSEESEPISHMVAAEPESAYDIAPDIAIFDMEPGEINDEDEEFKEEQLIEIEAINNNFIMKDETIADILDKLIKLEEKKLFLRPDFTLHNVAKRLKTNTAYLSKIVNNELGKNFSTYVNELRINYIIIELKNNSKLRSYSINAIAEEIGYKSPESFTKYFKVATGISPSIYIKKINSMLKNQNAE